MASDPSTLLEQGKCFQCSGASSAEILKLALLDEIQAGGSGTCANLEGAQADPTGIYTPEFIGQVYVTSGHVWQATGLTDADWTEICTDCVLDVFTFQAVTFDRFTIGADAVTTEFHFPNLTTILGATDNGNFDFYECTNLTTIDAPLLAIIDGAINCQDCPALTTITLPLLVSVTLGAIVFFNCTSLASFSLPSLVTVGGNVEGNDCTALVTFSCPVWLPAGGSTINFNNCALLAASVNQILARCVAAGVTTGNIDLSGGTNAAPTGQGILDKATLIFVGNAVVTN